jgi:hypothetical protein
LEAHLKKVTTLICLLAVGLLAGCGGGGNKTVTTSAATPPATPATPATTTPGSTTPSNGNVAMPQQGTMPSAPSGSTIDANTPEVQQHIADAISRDFEKGAGFPPDNVACGDVVSSTELRCTLRSQGQRFVFRVYDIDVNAGTYRITQIS